MTTVDQVRDLSAAMAAARRLLVHAIDIRFGIDELAEADEQSTIDPEGLRRLYEDVAALCRATEALREAL